MPGEIVTLEATQINLADGHYLKIGLALQLVEGARGGRRQQGAGRHDRPVQRALTTRCRSRSTGTSSRRSWSTELEERYEGDVMGVYFTEFVTQ